MNTTSTGCPKTVLAAIALCAWLFATGAGRCLAAASSLPAAYLAELDLARSVVVGKITAIQPLNGRSGFNSDHHGIATVAVTETLKGDSPSSFVVLTNGSYPQVEIR